MAKEENQTPKNTKHPLKPSISDENGTLFTPRFRSVAAMAGWDEEALLLASLVVEDTPDRESRHKKRINAQFKSPPTSSRRKKRVQRRQASIPMVILDLENEEIVGRKETDKKKETNSNGIKENAVEESRKDTKGLKSNTDGIKEIVVEKGGKEALIEQTSAAASSGSTLPCMNRLREELSCAICLDMCFEPSTTSCGHSFCKKCLRSAADKCGKKCPKCRQMISNGRSCTVNTVLWNTIQLLFPQEVETRKAAEATKICEVARRSPAKETCDLRNRSTRPSVVVASREFVSGRRRRDVPSQAEDAALALRLQREEFMGVDRRTRDQGRASSFTSAREVLERPSVSSARENLRAMASRANSMRVRRA